MDLSFLQCGLAIAYITHVLLYGNQYSGPIVRKDKFVYNNETHKSRPVTFFDYARRVLFSPYVIEQDEELWVERQDRLEIWSCPVCLSFWMSFFVSIPYYLISDFSLSSFFMSATLHFSSAIISVIINLLLEREFDNGLQLQKETSDSSTASVTSEANAD